MMMTAPILVLLLDDHASLRRNLMALLEDEGFLVMEANSGEEALQILLTQVVNVVIVDIRLPGMNGNEFIKSAHAVYPNLRFLIHTGVADYAMPEALRRFGLTENCVFQKPLADIHALLTCLRTLSGEEKGEE